MPNAERSISRLVELDSLRGFMALWVYLTHILFLVGFPDHGILGLIANGSMAVSVFMILSGFAIGTTLLNGRSTYGQYFARRFFRLYPVYLVGLLLGLMTSAYYPGLLTALGGGEAGDIARIAHRTQGEFDQFGQHLIAHLFLVHGAIPDSILYGSALAFNAPAWSLSLEVQFYIVAPFLVAILSNPRGRPIAFCAIIGLALFGRALFGDIYPQVPSFLPMTLTYFIIGILTAIHMPRIADRPDLLLVIGGLIVLLAARAGEILSALPPIIWVATILICTLDGWRPFAVARHILAWRPFVAMGEVSYGFYILHLPILIGWAVLLQRQGLASSKPAFLALLLLSLPVTIALAYISYRWLEEPINRWAKERYRGVREVATTVAPAEGV
ncbi:acyltransferase [Sphingobium sp. BYY-5]|uniref:acyltransferase family protein n=1 Tax=Sphingobium sp. BYY-5 TaxID=2926400 RepID=UPI001FA6BC33|nr:acyltransferase [Sphingobium sp. BYY-5]MCI4592673.1 acyltransferase [Sphingobium sp. BYY-5]